MHESHVIGRSQLVCVMLKCGGDKDAMPTAVPAGRAQIHTCICQLVILAYQLVRLRIGWLFLNASADHTCVLADHTNVLAGMR